MRKQMKHMLVIGTALLMTAPVYAEGGKSEGKDGHRGGYHSEMREKIKGMSEEEKKAFFEEKKAKWEAMSADEKVKHIEERRAEKRKAMDEQWESMSNEEKVQHVEEKMKRKMERWKGHREGKGGEGGEHRGPRGKHKETDAE